MNKNNLHTHTISPCLDCGTAPDSIKISRPVGRTADVYRVECLCGNGAQSMFSPSEVAAVRLWNGHNADNGKSKLNGRAYQGEELGISPAPHNKKTCPCEEGCPFSERYMISNRE